MQDLSSTIGKSRLLPVHRDLTMESLPVQLGGTLTSSAIFLLAMAMGCLSYAVRFSRFTLSDDVLLCS